MDLEKEVPSSKEIQDFKTKRKALKMNFFKRLTKHSELLG